MTTQADPAVGMLGTWGPIERLLVVGSLVVAAAVFIAFTTWAGWDEGGWTDSDGQVVDAAPFPWAGIVFAGLVAVPGLLVVLTGIVAKGVQLGRRAS